MIMERFIENNNEENRYLLEVNLNNLNIPLRLDKFVKQENIFHLEKKTRLLVYWREYLHTEIQSKLREGDIPKEERVFNFFLSDKNKYKNCYLQKFLQKVDYMFS